MIKIVNVESLILEGKAGETGGLPGTFGDPEPGGPGKAAFRNPKPAEVTESDMPMGLMREG